MSENEHDLDTLLAQLRIEFDALEEVDSDNRERLSGLLARLEHRLALPREDNEDEELLASLSDAITDYEVRYPNVTDLINRIMVSLSAMGI